MSLPVAKLEKLLDLRRVTSCRFITKNLPLAPMGSRSTFGGTLVAQSLLASMNTVPSNFIPSSLHCYFINGGNPQKMITYDVESLRQGNNFIHKEVKAYQDEKLIFQTIILFSIRNATATEGILHHLKKITIPSMDDYPYAADLFKTKVLENETLSKLSTANKTSEFTKTENVYKSFTTQPMEYHFPKTFFNSLKEGRNESLKYFVKIRKESVEVVPDSQKPDTELITPRNDDRYNYVAFAYLSDSYLLLTLPYFSNRPLYSHKFSASLDHTIHFHQLPEVNEFIYLDINNSKSCNHKHLMQGEYFDAKTGEIIASVSQEGFVIYDGTHNLRAKL